MAGKIRWGSGSLRDVLYAQHAWKSGWQNPEKQEIWRGLTARKRGDYYISGCSIGCVVGDTIEETATVDNQKGIYFGGC